MAAEYPLPYFLGKIEAAAKDKNQGLYQDLVSQCVKKFKNSLRARNDNRFLRTWFRYLAFCDDHAAEFEQIRKVKICQTQACLYVVYALHLEENEAFVEADDVYRLGISSNANPIHTLKQAHMLFLERMRLISDAPSSANKVKMEKA